MFFDQNGEFGLQLIWMNLLLLMVLCCFEVVVCYENFSCVVDELCLIYGVVSCVVCLFEDDLGVVLFE